MQKFTELELHWLAGYLEGEGCFFFTGYHKTCPIIQARATDKDVVERVARIMGVPFEKIKCPKKQKPHHKQQYKFYVGSDRATFWMRQLLPLMGDRRKETLTKILQLVSGT